MNINTNLSDFNITTHGDHHAQGDEPLGQTPELFSDYAKNYDTQTAETNVPVIEADNIEAVHQEQLLSASHPQENNVEGDILFARPDLHFTPQPQRDRIAPSQLGSPSTLSTEIKTPTVTTIQSDVILTQQAPEQIDPGQIGPGQINPRQINHVIPGQIYSDNEGNISPSIPSAEAASIELIPTQTKLAYPLEGIDSLDAAQRASNSEKSVQPNGSTPELITIKDPKVTVDNFTTEHAEPANHLSTSAFSSDVNIKSDLVSITPKTVGESVVPLTTLTTPVADALIRGPQTANIITSLPTSHPAVQTVAQNLIKVQETQSGVSVRLDPPEMGRVFIDFQFEADRSVTATIRSDVAETAIILKDKAEFFQQILKDNGFDTVTLNFEQNTSSKQNESDQFDESSSFSLSETELDEAIATALPATSLYKLSPETVIDIKL